MTVVLFQPHSDDAVLFATGVCLQYSPHIVTVLRSAKQDSQGVTQAEREAEDQAAFMILGINSFEQWPEPDTRPDWDAVRSMMKHMNAQRSIDHVWAPAIENDAPEQHNMVAELAHEVFGDSTRYYLTYTGGRSRSDWGIPVEFRPEWIARKHLALACYRSQHRLWSTEHHFMAPLNEWILK